MSTSISIRNIEKRYQEVSALKGITFDVNEAEIFGLIGPDGAGKTSLFRILTTLLLPDHGEAWVNGFHVVNDYRKIRNIIGYMPGRFSLYQDLTVEENLSLFASIFDTTIDENYDLVKDIYSQIEPFKNRRAGKLSGGMKQKLALSCALIHKPSILFLDEPTTGVDPVSRKEFWSMLKKLKNSGITILVSTPYMDEANLCDRIALIQDGNILSINTPKEIIQTFGKKVFSIKTDEKHQMLLKMRLYENTYSIFSFGDSLHYIDKRSNVSGLEITEDLRNMNLPVFDLSEIPPTVEDCFIDLMKKAK